MVSSHFRFHRGRLLTRQQSVPIPQLAVRGFECKGTSWRVDQQPSLECRRLNISQRQRSHRGPP